MRVFPDMFALAAGAAGLLMATGCGRPAVEDPARLAPPAVQVARVARVELREWSRTLPLAGTLRPRDHAVVSAKLMGEVARADFVVGQAVVAGEELVVLSAGEVAARLAQAEANLVAILREQAREAGLRDQGASPAEAVRTLEDRRRAAEAAVAEARTLQTYTRVTAPFAGVITGKLIQAGDLALPGAPLFALEGGGGLRAEIEVPGGVPMVSPGARLTVVYPGGETLGGLTEISPAVDAVTRTRLAKVELPEGAAGVGSGDFVRVLWPAGQGSALVVPVEAVENFGQMERCFVVEDGRARLRLVKSAGRAASGLLRIASGLEAGEIVVSTPSAALRDGQAVEVRP